MKILVIGQGGREHAMVKALSQSLSPANIFVAPGNAGMVEASRAPIDVTEFERLKAFILGRQIDTVVVGPEVPLALGLADQLRAMKVSVFGPDQAAAQLESSKIFAKEFMLSAGVPTAKFQVVRTVEETLDATRLFRPPYVFKVDGLAAGKGVFITDDPNDLKNIARMVFEENLLGESGKAALLEQFQPGYEISYLVLVVGESYQVLPLMQDHKRIFDNDRGANTGGMGVVGPIQLDTKLKRFINKEIVERSIAEMKRRNWEYRGILYCGLMVTSEGPTVIEYNVRFGDPEAQLILPLLDGSWAEVFTLAARGQIKELKWKNQFGCCVVLAAEGYPDSPKKNIIIEGDFAPTAEGYFLHAGTDQGSNGKFVTAGGRVLNALGFGNSLRVAMENAYQQASKVKWPGMQMRKDIGQKVLRDGLLGSSPTN